MFNPIATIRSYITTITTEPVIELDDTQEMDALPFGYPDDEVQEIPAAATAPVLSWQVNQAVLSPAQMLFARVAYRHFETDDRLYFGLITDVKETVFGTQVEVTPEAGQDARYPKWRSVDNDIAGYVWTVAVAV